MGFFQAVYAVGMTVFPVLAGSVENSLTETAAFYFMAVCLMAGFAASIVFYRKKRD